MVQLPQQFGGMAGEAIYLDSECTFVPERIAEMAKSVVNQLEINSSTFSPESVLSKIYYHRILNPLQLSSVVQSLEKMLISKPRVKLVVIDSIAAPLRQEFEDYTNRALFLTNIGSSLARLATKYKIAIVVTNQVTTKIGDKTSTQAASLGKAWSSIPAMQVMIGRATNSSERWAKLIKVLSPPLGDVSTCQFSISVSKRW